MIFAITGPDGSGKSTTCQKAAQYLESEFGSGSVAIASAWDIVHPTQLFSSRENAKKYLNNLDGYTRSLFIFHAVHRSIDLAKKKNPKIILVDGYWYKYAVSEIAMGIPRDWILNAAKTFPTPDFTLCLDIHPAQAVRRKKNITEYEQGNALGSNEFDRFVQFQTQMSTIWQDIENEFGPWQHVSSELSTHLVMQPLISACLRKVA